MTDQPQLPGGEPDVAAVLAEVLALQSQYEVRGGDAMARRGQLVLRDLPEQLRRVVAAIPAAADLEVEGSNGVGNYARIPWVRIFSRRFSPSAKAGWYVVVLFAVDGHAAYLSLNQGTTSPQVGSSLPRRREYLLRRVRWAHEFLGRVGLDREPQRIALHDKTGSLGSGYEDGDVTSDMYRVDDLPNATKFVADVTAMADRLMALYEAESELARLPHGYAPGEPLEGFGPPVPYLPSTIDGIPNEPGVHVVWAPDSELLYVGATRRLRSRMRQHLTGDRGASVLHGKVGRTLDIDLGRDAGTAEVRAYLERCSVAWMVTEDSKALKARVMDKLHPKYNEIRPQIEEQPDSAFCIYAGEGDQRNLQVGLEARTWGFKQLRPEYRDVRVGDWVVFAVGFEGDSLRTSLEVWVTSKVERLILGRITRPFYSDDSPVWPDELVGDAHYTHRFEFEVIDNIADVDLNDGTLGVDIVECVRKSSNDNGAGYRGAAVGGLFQVDADGDSRDLAEVCGRFASALTAANLDFGNRHLDRVRTFLVSLATKGLVLLTGLSGSGKTRLAIALGQWFGPGRLKVLAVRPDWTGPEPLLGYEDALLPVANERRAWSVPEALHFMLQAALDPTWPYLLVLDEMNLAHVERYFADVLSGMESGEPILPNLGREADGYFRANPSGPDRLPLPPNLLVVGTVNVDETTYMFSPKVLDRANTIEFRVRSSDLRVDALPPKSLVPAEPALVQEYLRTARDRELQAREPASNRDGLAEHLRHLHGLLCEYDFEFGHRAFFEAIRFAALLELAGETNQWRALDLVVKQKVLPRMHGSVKRLARPLVAVGGFAYDLSIRSGTELDDFEFDDPSQTAAVLPDTFDKVRRMMASLRANHFASYSE